MNDLNKRIASQLAASVHQSIVDFATQLGRESGAAAILFYGSNLRTGRLDGVLDYYVLLPGEQEGRIWPRVSFREWNIPSRILRAKIATMSLERFEKAASGSLLDTTIWARFVQPAVLVWVANPTSRIRVVGALSSAAQCAAKLAIALGPSEAPPKDYWRVLFQATYNAELRFEKKGREESILDLNEKHFDDLLALALNAAKIPFRPEGDVIKPCLPAPERGATLTWWRKRRMFGKSLNILRLLKASTTFEGAAKYAAWKIKRHTGVTLEVTPWQERHPVLAAPGALIKVWLERKKGPR